MFGVCVSVKVGFTTDADKLLSWCHMTTAFLILRGPPYKNTEARAPFVSKFGHTEWYWIFFYSEFSELRVKSLITALILYSVSVVSLL